jgi:carnitine-CoA ligase
VLLPHHVWLACGWLKAVETAINVEYRGDWLRGALEVTRPKAVVIHARYLPQLAAVRDALPPGTLVIVVGSPDEPWASGTMFGDLNAVPVAEFLAAAAADQAVAGDPAWPWDPASIVFTSGTTGASKGRCCPGRRSRCTFPRRRRSTGRRTRSSTFPTA